MDIWAGIRILLLLANRSVESPTDRERLRLATFQFQFDSVLPEKIAAVPMTSCLNDSRDGGCQTLAVYSDDIRNDWFVSAGLFGSLDQHEHGFVSDRCAIIMAMIISVSR